MSMLTALLADPQIVENRGMRGLFEAMAKSHQPSSNGNQKPHADLLPIGTKVYWPTESSHDVPLNKCRAWGVIVGYNDAPDSSFYPGSRYPYVVRWTDLDGEFNYQDCYGTESFFLDCPEWIGVAVELLNG